MAVTVYFAGNPDYWPDYEKLLPAALKDAGVDAEVTIDPSDPNDVDFIVYSPDSPVQNFTPFTNLKAVLSLWAGVESFEQNPTLAVPLARMVDKGLENGMVEWVTGHVLRHHLGMDSHIMGQDGIWRGGAGPPLAKTRSVTVLGIGALGLKCAQMLRCLGFEVQGWSRNPKSAEGIVCHTGPDGLTAALSAAEILVLLLPKTPETEDLLDAAAIAKMPKGAFVINPGRGPLINDDDLIAALDSGHLAHATLDVFRQEPLPGAHPFWAHPKITVTPHIAAETRPETASLVLAENIRRHQAGEPMQFLVDRAAHY